MKNDRGGKSSQDEQTLKEIRESLIELKLLASNLNSNSGKYSEIQHSLLLSGLNDALSLSQENAPISRGFCPMNIGHVAGSFAESFGERLGDRYARRVTIMVDETLPVIVGNPGEIISFLDCLVRGVLTQSPDPKLQISITEIEKSTAPGPRRSNIKFAVLSSGVFHINSAVRAGIKLAKRVNFETKILTNAEGAFGLQLIVPASVPASAIAMPFIPDAFCYISTDPLVRSSLEDVAGFHRVQAEGYKGMSKKLGQAPRLLFDCGELPSLTIRELKKAYIPRDALLLLRDRCAGIMLELLKGGYHNFINLPLVSTPLFRGLNGLDSLGQERAPSRHGAIVGRALVVDDAASSRATVRIMLEGLGYDVLEGADGLDLVKFTGNGERFDLIFCDLMMPHLDGISAIRHLRALEKGGTRVPAVLMTSYSEVAAEDKAIFAGFDVVLQKPLETKEFSKVVSRLRER
jgi:CheY-like chemotaxis protein